MKPTVTKNHSNGNLFTGIFHGARYSSQNRSLLYCQSALETLTCAWALQSSQSRSTLSCSDCAPLTGKEESISQSKWLRRSRFHEGLRLRPNAPSSAAARWPSRSACSECVCATRHPGTRRCTLTRTLVERWSRETVIEPTTLRINGEGACLAKLVSEHDHVDAGFAP